jgi:hypothetical protein
MASSNVPTAGDGEPSVAPLPFDSEAAPFVAQLCVPRPSANQVIVWFALTVVLIGVNLVMSALETKATEHLQIPRGSYRPARPLNSERVPYGHTAITQPLRGKGDLPHPFPRVAAARRPWATLRTPFGIVLLRHANRRPARSRAFPPQAVLGPCFSTGGRSLSFFHAVTPVYGRPAAFSRPS